MALYRYECESCSNQFTILVRHQAQADVPVCPECGSNETRRMVPRVAIQFKGSGYYKTDYARKGSGSSADKRSDDKGPDGSTEAKSATDPNPEKGTNDSPSSSSPSSSSPSRNSPSRNSPSRNSQDSKSANNSDTSSAHTKAAAAE